MSGVGGVGRETYGIDTFLLTESLLGEGFRFVFSDPLFVLFEIWVI